MKHFYYVLDTLRLNFIKLDDLYFNCTQTQSWYYLKVTHALLMPAVNHYSYEENKQFQVNILKLFLKNKNIIDNNNVKFKIWFLFIET